MPGEADMTVGDLNRLLDQLAGEAPGEERVAIFSHLIRVTTPEQMRWIVQIVLRDLKVSPCLNFAGRALATNYRICVLV